MLFGLGIDGVVLLYVRYLDERRVGRDADEAVRRMGGTASSVVLAQATFARILDFGLAKRNAGMVGASVSEEEATQSAFLTEPGIIAGTVGYMSPEQVRG